MRIAATILLIVPLALLPGRAHASADGTLHGQAGEVGEVADSARTAGAAPVAGDTVTEEGQEQERRLRVFLDCPRWLCDFDYLREEVPYVDYVRNRQVADVQVLVTVERTGAGGGQSTLDFIGRNRFEGTENRLTFQTPPTATDAETRSIMARHLQLGLAAFAARTDLADRLTVEYEGPGGEEEGTDARPDDPWNLWVFRTSLGGSVGGESARNSSSIRSGISANRTTRDWKWDFGVRGSYSESNFDVDDGDGGIRTITSIRRSYGFDALGVRSIGRHWGAGGQLAATHSTFRNYDLSLRGGPAVEYNIFPYEESTRRQLTLLYALTVASLDYDEQTIFFETYEVRPRESLTVSLDVEEPWGEASLSVEGAHYFHDLEKNRLTVGGNVQLEIWGGFSVRIGGHWARVRDQINLPAGDATEEEVLLRQRELATDFEYGVFLNLGYTFGSIYNNVVNSRFESLDGGGGRFF